MERKLSTIKCFKEDLKLLKKIKADMGYEKNEDVIHLFIQRYYSVLFEAEKIIKAVKILNEEKNIE